MEALSGSSGARCTEQMEKIAENLSFVCVVTTRCVMRGYVDSGLACLMLCHTDNISTRQYCQELTMCIISFTTVVY